MTDDDLYTSKITGMIADNEMDIDILNNKFKRFIITLIALSLSIILAIILAYYILSLDKLIVSAYIALTIIFLGLVGGIYYTSIEDKKKRLKAENNYLNKKISSLSPSASGGTIPYYDRLVEINLDNLEKYYKLIKIHADNSFFIFIAFWCSWIYINLFRPYIRIF
jgi:hypothetical protein